MLRPKSGSRSLVAALAPVKMPAVAPAEVAPGVAVGPGLLKGKLIGEAVPVPPAFLQPVRLKETGRPKATVRAKCAKNRGFCQQIGLLLPMTPLPLWLASTCGFHSLWARRALTVSVYALDQAFL